ncbi:MAG: hypothetical protein ACXVPQ_08990, partial [Bacteroidia bacterium]
MNKHLLLGSALLAAISAYPQTGKHAKPAPSGHSDRYVRLQLHQNDVPSAENTSVKNTPVKAAPHATASQKVAASQAASCVHFAASYNALGVYIGGQECLQYNADVNAVTFVHRASPSYSTVPNGNSGTIVAKYSTNAGTSWDSTVFYANTTNFGRYPQGGLYNPAGNTNINNAYIVGAGPTNQGGNWLGAFIASKKITTPGTTTAGSDQQYFSNSGPFTLGDKFDFPKYGFNFTQDGHVRMIGAIDDDINGTTNLAYNPRGAALLKGTFNAGAFIWSLDTMVPSVYTRSDGSRYLTDRYMNTAWNDAGTVGYVMMIGAKAGTSGATRGYQPIIYKTTTSGATWTLMPSQNFATSQFQGIVDRLYPVTTNTNLIIPFFGWTREGIDMCVDVNNNLHIATTMVGTYSSDIDSLDYTYSFGTQQYAYPFNGPFGFPCIYDLYTTSSGTWNYHIVDSMGTEGPSGTSTYPGYGYNQWAASGASIEARIQVSFSPDRKKIFYSWTETDTLNTPNLNWNQFPNIQMKGYDVTIDKVTPRVNVTTMVPIADQNSYFHFMSNRAITTNVAASTNEIPFTISVNNLYDINQVTSHYYLKGASLTQADFTLNPMRPVGVQNLAANTANYEVSNYPNPANGSTTIQVSMKDPKPFELNIYTSVGQLIKTINVDGK